MKARHRALLGAAHGQGSTAAAMGGRGMDRAEFGLKPLRLQRVAHHIDLPIGHKGVAGMLQLATTTGFVVAAGCLHAGLGWGFDTDIHQLAAVDKAADDLARQGAGGKKRAFGDPVSLRAKAQDRSCGSGCVCHGA